MNCYYCGTHLTTSIVKGHALIKQGNWHKDHKQPKSRGGHNGIENMVDACANCNSRKCAKTVEEYREYLATSHHTIANMLDSLYKKAVNYSDEYNQEYYLRYMSKDELQMVTDILGDAKRKLLKIPVRRVKFYGEVKTEHLEETSV